MADDDRLALEQELARLRDELAATRTSTSFRIGHALVRAVRTLDPRRWRASPSPVPRPAEAAVPPSDGELPAAPVALEPPPAHPPYPTPGPQAEVRQRPTVTWLERPSPDGLPAGPVFVGGTGRSGTWVLGRLLHAHPRWTTVHTELQFHAERHGFRSVLAGRSTPEEFQDRVIDRWARVISGDGHPKGLQLVIPGAELREQLRRFLDRAGDDVADALGQLMLDVVDPYARARGAAGWTETTPANAIAAEALLTVLPRAKVLHAVRDGRDVAASVTRMHWGAEDIEAGLTWWAKKLLAAHAGTTPVADRVHTVRLEEFVHLDRDRSFDDLLAFLAIEDEEDRLRDYFDRSIDAARGHVGRWRQQVDAADRDRIDGRYRELLDELRGLGVACLPTDPDAVDDLVERTTSPPA